MEFNKVIQILEKRKAKVDKKMKVYNLTDCGLNLLRNESHQLGLAINFLKAGNNLKS